MAISDSRKLSARALSLSILSFISNISSVSAALVSRGLSVNFNNIDYYISPYSSGKIDVPDSSLSKVPFVLGFKPVTVIQGGVAQKDVASLLSNWTTADDVYQAGFSEAIFLVESGNKPRMIKKRHESNIITTNNTKIPSGPYFLELSTGSLYPVYRLYEDFAGAFVESLIPTPDGKFQPLSAQVSGSASLTIGVPSRLYFTKTESKPLAGVRIGVKDIYRLAGVKGSNGNRAWYNLYPASNYTGPAIQRLINAGAQIVGLQKTSQFANGESPTADWVDYHAPFNPRGDGYQDASASSSGAGASVAAYDWLDIAIGSDTGGSVRGPAGVQGLFGNRPSHNLVSLDNVMPLAPTLDTPGFLVRDPQIWEAASAVLYGKNYNSLSKIKPRYPQKIHTLSFAFFADADMPEWKLLLDFADALAKFVGGTVTPLNLEREWATSKPTEAGNLTLSRMLNTTYATIIAKEQTTLVRDPFYRDYAAAHEGRRPFVNPVPLSRWAYGDTLPKGALEEAYTQKSLFMNWFNSKIALSVSDSAQCSSSLVLYPQNLGDQNPRNIYYADAPGAPLGFWASRISVLAGIPDHVFPLGEVASFSEISQHDEYLPVGVSIMAAKGCDGLLIKLAQDLVAAGIIKVPKAGGTLGGSSILMRRGLEDVHDHQ